MTTAKTQGLIAAPPTAFRDNGAVDLHAVAPLAAHLRQQGVVGVFVNGTTGEGLSLTIEEREQLAAEWRRTLPAGMKLFIHVGHDCQSDAARLARHAQAIGADAVAAVVPSFFKPAGVEAAVTWCQPVAAAAPATPFYYYHIPSMSSVSLSVARLLERAANCIPNLGGAKFTFEAMADYQEALELEHGRFDVLWGRDEMLLGALATGAAGAVGSTYNVMAPLFRALISAFEAGDLSKARAMQAQAIRAINLLVASGNFFAALKAVLHAQGVPIGSGVRSPLMPLATDRAASVAEAVQAVLRGP